MGNVRIDLGKFGPDYEGKWVEVKPRLTFGDRQAIRRAMRSVGEGGQITVDPEASDMALMRRAVQSWAFEVPVSEEEIERLDGELGDWLRDEIAAHYQSMLRPEEEAKDSGGN